MPLTRPRPQALRRSGEGEGDDDEMEEAAGGGAGLDEIASRAASRATVFDAAAGARAARVASGVTLEAGARLRVACCGLRVS